MEHLNETCACSGKQCSKCEGNRCVLSFSRDKYKSSGLKSDCKQCVKEFKDAKRGEINSQSRDYYRRNAGEIIKKTSSYRVNHIEWAKSYSKKYRESTDPDHKAALQSNERARRHKAEGFITAREWKDLKDQYNHTCLKCGRKEPSVQLTVDHVTPLSKGGSNWIDNIQPLCITCNKERWTYTIDYRLQSSGICDLAEERKSN